MENVSFHRKMFRPLSLDHLYLNKNTAKYVHNVQNGDNVRARVYDEARNNVLAFVFDVGPQLVVFSSSNARVHSVCGRTVVGATRPIDVISSDLYPLLVCVISLQLFPLKILVLHGLFL